MTTFDQIVFYTVVFGVGAAILAYLASTLRQAGHALGGNGPRTARGLTAGLLIWAALALGYALVAGPDVLFIVPAVAIPLVGGVALTFWQPVRALLGAIRLERLVGVQFYRVAGALFLYGYYFTDMPGSPGYSFEFAVNAGWGDVLTGVLAVPTALAVAYRLPFWGLAVLGWSAIGIGDLILAPYSGITFGGPAMDDFPLSVIPLFIGPPLGLLLHLVTLRVLWIQRGTAEARLRAA